MTMDDICARIRNVRVVSKLSEGGDEGKVAIATHSGSFHADEALACAMLKCLPQYKESIIVRTRDEAIISQCVGAVVDVGAVYDAEKRRFDHHQRSFAASNTFPGRDIKLSSAGLIYKHFGTDILQAVFGPMNKDTCAVLLNKIYDKFVKEIDAIDNGVSLSKTETAYKIHTNLSARVGRLNPRWNATDAEKQDSARNGQFKRAMEIAFKDFFDIADSLKNSWLPARKIVVDALKVPVCKGIVRLERYCPWSSHVFDVEAEMDIEGQTVYVLYQDTHGNWRVQAVPPTEGSFDCRKKLPESWRGVRGSDLDKIAGVEGCIFVHAAGFIGGAKTYDAALALAKKSLAM